MKEQLEQRLRELQAEFEAGQNMLTDLETQQANLKETLLRISGAMQVLQEMLANTTDAESPVEAVQAVPEADT